MSSIKSPLVGFSFFTHVNSVKIYTMLTLHILKLDFPKPFHTQSLIGTMSNQDPGEIDILFVLSWNFITDEGNTFSLFKLIRKHFGKWQSSKIPKASFIPKTFLFKQK